MVWVGLGFVIWCLGVALFMMDFVDGYGLVFLRCILVFAVGCILILAYLFSCCISCLGSFGFRV